MLIDYYTIAIIGFLAVVSPGPDFFVVAKYALGQNRQKAVLASLGIGAGILIHTLYCVLGLALVISQSIVLFSLIKYLGAAYLIYLGIKGLFSSHHHSTVTEQQQAVTSAQAFRNGLLTNLLNPKCTLFMLSVFTLVIKPSTPHWIQMSYGLEQALIAIAWFIFLSYSFTHSVIQQRINKAQRYVNKVIGGVLVSLGLFVAFEGYH